MACTARLIYTQFFDLNLCTQLIQAFQNRWKSARVYICQILHDLPLQRSIVLQNWNHTVWSENRPETCKWLFARNKLWRNGIREKNRLFQRRGWGWLHGASTEIGILGMLKGNDYENIDQVSPRFAKLVSGHCENSKNAPVTDVFTQHGDLVHAIGKDYSQPVWTEREICRNCSNR